MDSLNPAYEHIRFHKDLAALAGIKASTRVLDLGCGSGRTIREAIDRSAQVVGIDSKEEFLEQAGKAFGNAIANEQLELTMLDLNRERLPFPDASFETIVCQNVLEYIHNKQELIAESYRCLKPNGVFLLSHHDFGGIMIQSSQTTLTRSIVAAYADETQNWMDASDGEMGRQLPGLMHSSRFTNMTTETRPLVGFSFAPGTYAHDYCGAAASAAKKAGMNAAAVTDWLSELEDLDRRGAFYFAIPWVYVKAVK